MTLRRPPLTELITRGTNWHGRWGRLDTTPHSLVPLTRAFTAQLSIYPPGTTRRERVLLGVQGLGATWLGWVITALVVVVAMMLGGPWTGLAAACVLVALWGVVSLVTEKLRRNTRHVRMSASSAGEAGGGRLNHIAQLLDDLDTQELDPVAYELQWGRIYDEAANVIRGA
ncbi:DUF6611 family protein [Curtobacterium flaccumfaciens]|uniref:DUF6611 family protein n=1 Tax=Curtobacterium flaccumfaciens TaxID=2035 RepID=UPI002F267426